MDVVWANWSREPGAYKAMENWASRRIYGSPRSFGQGTAMGVLKGGEAIAVMVFYDYDADAGVIQISGAADSPRWLTKPVLFEMFAYPFNELGCQSVVMRVDPADTRLGRILPAYGFSKHVLPRMRGRDKDDAIYILHDDVWRGNGYHRENSGVLPVDAQTNVGDVAA